MALVGNMIAEAKAGDPSVVNYTMFVSVFGMLSLFYLIAGTINENFAIAPIFMLIADALHTIFFFCGGVALAADLDFHSCGNQVWLLRLVFVGSGQGARCANFLGRAISTATASPTVQTTQASAAVKHKP